MAVDVKKSDFELVEDDGAFAERLKRWASEPYLAIDTEFMRENTYYAKPGLIQIADGHGVDLIDPLKVSDLSALAPILSDQGIVKIMHSMSEDIELLHQLTGVQPRRVFDTQTAAALLGHGASLGYQNLVAKVLDVALDKSETRSNWLQRPLSDRQLEYAAKDAVFLIQLYQIMCPRLEKVNLLDAVFEESQFVIAQNVESWQQPDLAYLRLRGAWDLPLAHQQLLKSLVSTRDQIAKQNNVPKPWVFSDHCLIQIAQEMPQSINELKRIDKVKFKSIRLYGDAILEQIVNFAPGQSAGFVSVEKPIKGNELIAYKALKKIVDQVSDASGIASQVLGSRKMLERIVIHRIRHGKSELPSEFMGWRRHVLGEKLIAATQN